MCPSSTTHCHNSGLNMGKCMLIGVIHICSYWTSTGSMIMFSHWWVIFEGSVMFCSYSKQHASYGHLNSGMRFCAKWRKSLTDGKWCWAVCLTKLVAFSFAYLEQHWSKCLSQRCPCTSVKCFLLCSFFYWLS